LPIGGSEIDADSKALNARMERVAYVIHDHAALAGRTTCLLHAISYRVTDFRAGERAFAGRA